MDVRAMFRQAQEEYDRDIEISTHVWFWFVTLYHIDRVVCSFNDDGSTTDWLCVNAA